MKPPSEIRLTPGKRVLFLTKDPELIRRQLRGELDLQMKNLRVEDPLDDINTDAMTPAWVCFDHRPEDLSRNAYAGLIVDGNRLFEQDALRKGNFEVNRMLLAKYGKKVATALCGPVGEYQGLMAGIAFTDKDLRPSRRGSP